MAHKLRTIDAEHLKSCLRLDMENNYMLTSTSELLNSIFKWFENLIDDMPDVEAMPTSEVVVESPCPACNLPIWHDPNLSIHSCPYCNVKFTDWVKGKSTEKQCNNCKYYEGVHHVQGHAPCSYWHIGGVMWDDGCPRFCGEDKQ